MYWYIKYPLILILVVVCLGLAGLVLRSCRTAAPAPAPEQPEVAATEPPKEMPVPVDPSIRLVRQEQALGLVPPPPPVPGAEERLAAARKQLDQGMLEAARKLARQVIKMEGVTEFDPVWRRGVEIIDDADKRLMNSSAPAQEKGFYRVVRGDSLARIASRHYTSVGALIRCNESLHREDGRDPVIRPSQTLSYIQGTWSIRVSKQHFLLLLYLDGELYRVWTVGIGKENRTPSGRFLVTDKLTDPAWTPPGRFIAAGDPENVLGTRWLKLTPAEGTDPSLEGYGIHGTTEPDTVGTSCSAGCIRMRNEEVEELFDFIPMPGGSTPPVRVSIEE
ncbi:MAG: L,D-transpeptidase family protein [Oligosphaeraceae bacterium]